MTKLEEFCFDVLGDMIDPRDINVQRNQKKVYALCRPPVTPEMVGEEWRLQTKGTEYEGIPLYVGSALV